MEQKLDKAEKRNAVLEQENRHLKEKMLELEYRQNRNNLIIEGVFDEPKETDISCIHKVRSVLRLIPPWMPILE